MLSDRVEVCCDDPRLDSLDLSFDQKSVWDSTHRILGRTTDTKRLVSKTKTFGSWYFAEHKEFFEEIQIKIYIYFHYYGCFSKIFFFYILPGFMH